MSKTATMPLLEIKGAVDPNGQAEATLPVRWCVSQALVNMLTKKGVKNPYLLVSVRPYTMEDGERHYGRETSRELVPLTREMTYVGFGRPGLNEVSAMVVWNNDKGLLYLKSLFLSHNNEGFHCEVFDVFDGNLNVVSTAYSYDRKRTKSASILTQSEATLDVEVPRGMFAPEPRQWVKDYMNKFTSKRFVDQCHMRKFKWPALALIWLILPLEYVLRALLLIGGLVLGLRKLSLSGFKHPLRYTAVNVVYNKGSSIWFTNKDGEPRAPYVQLLNPATNLFALPLLLNGLGGIDKLAGLPVIRLWSGSYPKAILASVIIHLAIIAGILTLALLALLLTALGSSLGKLINPEEVLNNIKDKQTKSRASREAAWLEYMERELLDMTCRTEASAVDIEALPERKQTLRLRFYETKRQVCRPYAR